MVFALSWVTFAQCFCLCVDCLPTLPACLQPSLVDAAIAATFDHAATAVNDGDDYLNINEDEAEDDDDAADVLAEAQALGYGAAGSGSAADDVRVFNVI